MCLKMCDTMNRFKSNRHWCYRNKVVKCNFTFTLLFLWVGSLGEIRLFFCNKSCCLKHKTTHKMRQQRRLWTLRSALKYLIWRSKWLDDTKSTSTAGPTNKCTTIHHWMKMIFFTMASSDLHHQHSWRGEMITLR